MAEGMDAADLASYNYDDVKAEVSRYADPYATFRMEIVSDDKAGKSFLVFAVEEFEEIPVICKKNGLENLQEAAIYTRPRGVASTAKAPSQSEMRELLNMAISETLG